MKKTNKYFIALITAVVAIIVWKAIPPSKKINDTPPAQKSTLSQRSERADKKNHTQKSQPNNPKWESLTDDRIDTQARVALARQIDNHMTASEIDLLFQALRHKPEVHNRQDWSVVLNEIMEQMRRKGIGSHRFANELIALIKDQTFSEVGRDYAAQHLSFWITPSVNEAPSETSEKIIKKAIQTIADTITDPSLTDTSLPGTSLMLLVQVGEKLPPKIMTPLWAKLDPALTSILKGQVYAPLATKVSIIQSVAIRHSAQHLSLIQSMARNEEIDPSIRLSSIAALGFYQSQDDYNYIAQLANGTSPFRFAAQSALKKISNKH